MAKWLTPSEVIEETGLSKTHVYALIASGELEAVDYRLPGRTKAKYKVSRDALTRFQKRRVVNHAA